MTPITADSRIDVRLPHRQWIEVCQLLDDRCGEKGEFYSGLIQDQIPELTPTDLGAVVRANVAGEETILVLAAPDADGEFTARWRSTDGRWLPDAQVEILHVLARGVRL